MRRPGLAWPLLRRRLETEESPAVPLLLAAFFILERWGRGAELQEPLERAHAAALVRGAHQDAAELSEALGRLHYQRGDYLQACNAWGETLTRADDDTRWACLARIGLAHLCFAQGDWARGGRVLDQAEAHYARLAEDPYLRAKIALNRAASARATQGPEAALLRLEEARGAAREAGHRDYQAEATWHHARCRRDSGAPDEALRLARQAEDLARRCRYRWLQAHALLLISELTTGGEALASAEQALSIGASLQSRSVQAAAHARLSPLMAEQGALGPSWHHQQQRQRLEVTLVPNELPARLEQLARFDAPSARGVTAVDDVRALVTGLERLSGAPAEATSAALQDLLRHARRLADRLG